MGLTKVKINLGTQGNLSGSRSIIQSTKTLVSSSAQMHEEISGSFTAASSSFSTRVTTMEGSGTAQGVGTSDSPTFNNITATGTVTAQEFHSEFVSASVTFTSGSHKFGNSTDDVHNMTGSLNVSGTINLNDGNLSVTDKMIIGSGSGFDFSGTNHSFTVKSSGNNSGFSILASGGGELVRFIQESNDAGQMDFYDGGSPKIRLSSHANANNYISNGGNVGIGTTSPAVRGEIKNASSGVPATSGTTQTNGVLRLSSTATTGIIDIGMNGSAPWIQATDSGGLNNNYKLLLNPNGGNVGIGTNNPATTFHVSESNGGVRFTFGSDSQLDFARDANGVYMSVGSNQHLRFLYDNGSSEAVRIADGGNVGIGTTSPGSVLHVRVGSNQNLGFNSSSSVFRLSAFNDAVNANVPLLINASSLRFGISDSEKMRISSAGNVGIGTNSPQGILDINASSRNAVGDLDDADDYAIVIRNSSTTGEGNGIAFTNDGGQNVGGAILHIDKGSNNLGDLAFYTNANSSGDPSERMRIESNGQTGIGTNSVHDNVDFEVNGNIGSRKAFYHTKHQNNSLNKNGYSNIESGFIGDDMARQAIMYRTGHIYSSSGGTSSDFLTAYTSGHWGNHYHGWMYAWTTYYGTGHRKYRWHCSEGNLNLTQLETWGTDAQATITVGSQTSVGSGTHSGQNVQKQTFTLNTNAGYVGAYATILVCYSASGFPHLDNASSASDVQSDATSAGARLHFLTMDITGSPHRDTT